MYVMLCGFPPFQEETNTALFDAIKSGRFDFPSPYWDQISAPAKDLIQKCLQVDPANRITAEEMMHHEWIVSEATPRRDMSDVTETLRKFLLRRKFKKVGYATIASNKLLALGKLAREKRGE